MPDRTLDPLAAENAQLKARLAVLERAEARRRRRRRDRRPPDAGDWTARLDRTWRAYIRFTGHGDLEALADMATFLDAGEASLRDAIALLRHEPWCYSWADIGDALDISKQAAQQRFGKAGGARRAGGQPAHLR